MAPIRPNLWSIFDIFAGFLLLYTTSPLPAVFAEAHAGFLIFKGIVTQLPIPPIPPVFIIGNGADIISAAILLVGQPPILGDYKELIALFLFQKGAFGLLGTLMR